MPRFQFTVRRMMVAVAIVGVVLGGAEMIRRRRTDFIVRSTQWRWSENVALRGRAPVRFVYYSRRLAEKYEHAARYPWLPVAPDPPEPE